MVNFFFFVSVQGRESLSNSRAVATSGILHTRYIFSTTSRIVGESPTTTVPSPTMLHREQPPDISTSVLIMFHRMSNAT